MKQSKAKNRAHKRIGLYKNRKFLIEISRLHTVRPIYV